MEVRPVRLRWADRPVPRHFVGGDLIQSHLAVVASSMFPPGEAFFVRSVRHFRDQITDPALAADVTAFVGQESMHAREHRSLNRRLAELGYPTARLERRATLALRVLERLLTPRACLAATAALEHVTATLAEAILSSADVRDLFLDEQVRRLVVWHALEECEHKAVAFDVYRAVGGRRWVVVGFFRLAMVTSTFDLLGGLFTTMWSDPAARRRGAVLASLRALPTSPFARAGVRDGLAAFARPGFHPTDRDTSALTASWAARLAAEAASMEPVAPPADV